MPLVLHLLKADSDPTALNVIERQSREPGTEVTVVLIQGAAPPLPAGLRVRRLGNESAAPSPDTLTYSDLLDLIFSADQVISW